MRQVKLLGSFGKILCIFNMPCECAYCTYKHNKHFMFHFNLCSSIKKLLNCVKKLKNVNKSIAVYDTRSHFVFHEFIYFISLSPSITIYYVTHSQSNNAFSKNNSVHFINASLVAPSSSSSHSHPRHQTR